MKRVLPACRPASLPVLGGESFVDAGSDRQLFRARQLIDEMRCAEFELHRPVLGEEVLRYERPWEGDNSRRPIVIKDWAISNRPVFVAKFVTLEFGG